MNEVKETKKYELTDETITLKTGEVLHRIKALRDIYNEYGCLIAKEGSLGGFIEKERNLSHDGSCWVAGNAWVYGNAKVFGDVKIYSDAKIYNKTKLMPQIVADWLMNKDSEGATDEEFYQTFKLMELQVEERLRDDYTFLDWIADVLEEIQNLMEEKQTQEHK